MRPATLAGLVLLAAAGCQSGLRCVSRDPCAECGTPPTRPAPAQVQCDEEVVVRVPQQKIILETQEAKAPPPAPPAGFTAPPAGFAVQPTAPAAFAGGMQMMTVPAGQGFAAAPVVGQVREGTRLGFALDTFRIPIPYLRPIAVPKPAEVTFQMPVAPQPTGFSGAMAVPVAAGPPAGFVAPAVGFAASQPAFTMVPQPAIGYGQVTVQGQMTAQQAGFLQAGAQGQSNFQQSGSFQAPSAGQLTPQQLAQIQAFLAAQAAAGSGGPPAGRCDPPGDGGQGSASMQDRAKVTAQQIADLERKCEELRRLKESLAPPPPVQR